MSRAKHYSQFVDLDPGVVRTSQRRARIQQAQRRAEAALMFLAGTAFGAALTNFLILWVG